MTARIWMIALVLALPLTDAAMAADAAEATTEADCEQAGGAWNAQDSKCAEESAKMGKEEGTHEGANLGATPENDTKKTDQPEHPTTGN